MWADSCRVQNLIYCKPQEKQAGEGLWWPAVGLWAREAKKEQRRGSLNALPLSVRFKAPELTWATRWTVLKVAWCKADLLNIDLGIPSSRGLANCLGSWASHLEPLGPSPPCKIGIRTRHASPVAFSSSFGGQGSSNTMVEELRLLEGSLCARLHIKCSLHAHSKLMRRVVS